MNKRNYETLFVLTPVLSDEQIQETTGKVVNFLKNNKSEIVYESGSELKKLSYPIDGKLSGVYNVIEFRASPDVVKLLEIEYKREEKIIRFLTIVLDKHGIAYNEKKRLKTTIEQTNKTEINQ